MKIKQLLFYTTTHRPKELGKNKQKLTSHSLFQNSHYHRETNTGESENLKNNELVPHKTPSRILMSDLQVLKATHQRCGWGKGLP